MHDFLLMGCDTDSVLIGKQDGSEFSTNEQSFLVEELNSIFPEGISWEHDGVFKKVIYFGPKNYILWDGITKKTKGSALRDQKKEIGLREFCDKVIDSIIDETYSYNSIYTQYVKEIMNVKDIKRWASKKTYSEKVEEGEGTSQVKMRNAMEGSEYVIGDKFYVFFKNDDSLGLVENFDGDYNKTKLLKKLHKCAQVFSSILESKIIFPDLSLKKNINMLQEIVSEGLINV